MSTRLVPMEVSTTILTFLVQSGTTVYFGLMLSSSSL